MNLFTIALTLVIIAYETCDENTLWGKKDKEDTELEVDDE